jgi:hypothetical protein
MFELDIKQYDIINAWEFINDFGISLNIKLNLLMMLL